MNGTNRWLYSALVGAAALIVGCGPDDREPNAAAGGPGSAPPSRNEAGQPVAANGSAIRPPTTATSPAAPGAAVPPAATPRLMARAEVQPLGDQTARGLIEFQTAAGTDGPVTIHVVLMGLDAGPHGMHIHSGTDCAAVGDHLNPQNAPHGPQNAGAAARHLGDLGNITADASGMVEEMLRDAQLGADSTFIGKVIVVHKGQDDLSTQPGGDSGDPIACGVIEPADQVISRGGDPNAGV